MKITSQEEYGLRCLLRLARADGWVVIAEIAADEGLTGAYVAKLLGVLRHAGLIESERGRMGGYRLARPADEISLGVVLMALGEPLYEEETYCTRHAGTETDGHCVHASGCTLRGLWLTLEHWMRQALDQLTLADLMCHQPGIAELLRARLAQTLADEPPTTLIPLTLANKS
jgi:Rrf2 family protein